jgi:uncharacterized membrane-anchored protein
VTSPVLDVLDLDRPTAQALADAGSPRSSTPVDLISGRYPNLGPEVLRRGGVVLCRRRRTDGLAAIKDGTSVRVHDGSVYVGDRRGVRPGTSTRSRHRDRLAAARRGMIQPAAELHPPQQRVPPPRAGPAAHGSGLPTLRTAIATVAVGGG